MVPAANLARCHTSRLVNNDIGTQIQHASLHSMSGSLRAPACSLKQASLQTATALGKLGHPDGELNLTRAAAKHGVIQMIPTLASCSFDEIMDCAKPGQVQFFQLCAVLLSGLLFIDIIPCRYVNKDRNITKRIVQHAEDRGIKGLFITVDAPQLGRREKVSHWHSCRLLIDALMQDMRMKFEAEDPSEVAKAGADGVDRTQGAARAISVRIVFIQVCYFSCNAVVY